MRAANSSARRWGARRNDHLRGVSQALPVDSGQDRGDLRDALRGEIEEIIRGEIYEALDELSRLILPVDGAPWPAEATQAEDDDGEGEISDDRQ